MTSAGQGGDEVREALDEIAGKSKDLLASIEEVKKQFDITIEDLKEIKNQELEIIEHLDSIIEREK